MVGIWKWHKVVQSFLDAPVCTTLMIGLLIILRTKKTLAVFSSDKKIDSLTKIWYKFQDIIHKLNTWRTGSRSMRFIQTFRRLSIEWIIGCFWARWLENSFVQWFFGWVLIWPSRRTQRIRVGDLFVWNNLLSLDIFENVTRFCWWPEIIHACKQHWWLSFVSAGLGPNTGLMSWEEEWLKCWEMQVNLDFPWVGISDVSI
jgi:hypothetical protein